MKRAHGQMSESLLLGAMLAMAGGFFDAYTYLCRGKVFANAQTGNIVLFGANIAEGNWLRAAEYFLPILAFALGVVAAEIVKRRYKKRQSDINIHWRQIVVLVEIVLLITAAFLPQSMNTTVNIMISFICAMPCTPPGNSSSSPAMQFSRPWICAIPSPTVTTVPTSVSLIWL